MMRLPNLIRLGERENVPVITIEALIRFMEERRCEADPKAEVVVPEWQRVSFEVETTVPTEHGSFRVRAYRDLAPTLRQHVEAIDSADVRYDGRIFVRPARGRPAPAGQPQDR